MTRLHTNVHYHATGLTSPCSLPRKFEAPRSHGLLRPTQKHHKEHVVSNITMSKLSRLFVVYHSIAVYQVALT
mgnify:CR=1 FL=1